MSNEKEKVTELLNQLQSIRGTLERDVQQNGATPEKLALVDQLANCLASCSPKPSHFPPPTFTHVEEEPDNYECDETEKNLMIQEIEDYKKGLADKCARLKACKRYLAALKEQKKITDCLEAIKKQKAREEGVIQEHNNEPEKPLLYFANQTKLVRKEHKPQPCFENQTKLINTSGQNLSNYHGANNRMLHTEVVKPSVTNILETFLKQMDRTDKFQIDRECFACPSFYNVTCPVTKNTSALNGRVASQIHEKASSTNPIIYTQKTMASAPKTSSKVGRMSLAREIGYQKTPQNQSVEKDVEKYRKRLEREKEKELMDQVKAYKAGLEENI